MTLIEMMNERAERYGRSRSVALSYRSKVTRAIRLVAALAMLLVGKPPPSLAAGESVDGVGSDTEVVAATGVWRLSSAGEAGAWKVEGLRLDGKEIRGRIESGAIGGANVEARLSGRGVVGKLLDDEGRTLAVFEGAVAAGGASGTFRHVGGAAGTWTWDRPDGKDQPATIR